MKVELVTDRRGLDRLAPQWNELLAASQADSIFLTWEFISTWLDVLVPRCRIHTLAVRDDAGKLVAIAPFYLQRVRLAGMVPYRCLRVLGDQESAAEYGDVICARGLEEQASRELGEWLAQSQAWDSLWLCNLANWTGGLARVENLAKSAGLHTQIRPRAFSAITLPDSFDAYLEQLSKKTRYNLRRGRRQVEDLGKTEYRLCETPDQVSAFTEPFVRLHQAHWEAAGDLGTFVRRPRLREFFEKLSLRFVEKGWLRLGLLEVNGEPQAAQFGFQYGGVFSAVQEGYNPNLAEVTCGIGNVARAWTIERAIEERAHTYDFLGGETWHKQRWNGESREGSDAFVHRRTLRTLPLRVREVWPTGRYMTWDARETAGSAL